MALHKHTDGDVIYADETNQDNAEAYSVAALNLIRTLQDRSIDFSEGGFDWFADAYVDSDGQMNSVDTDETSADFDTDKYKPLDLSTLSYYLIIEATNISESAFSVNSCTCKKYDPGKWIIYGTKTNVLRTLFSGDNPRIINSSCVTGLTAIKTSDSDDVGLKAYRFSIQSSTSYTTHKNGKVNYTFSDTSNNKVISYIEELRVEKNCAGNGYINWEHPSGTTKVNLSFAASQPETISDKGIYESDNPSSLELEFETGNTNNDSGDHVQVSNAEGFFTYTSGTVTESETDDGDITWTESHETFSGVPAFTDGTSESVNSIITHDIPSGKFSDTISNCIGVPLISDWETGADIKYKLINATEDSGWLDCGNTPQVSSFTAFTSEPTKLIIKLVPKTSSPTSGYPSIKGFAVRATE